MDTFILDAAYKAVAVLDTFQSRIWTDRYNRYGDFEVYIPAIMPVCSFLQEGYYLYSPDLSDRMMIIEDIQLKCDPEDGDFYTVTGRSLESILARRVIWGYREIKGNLQEGVKALLNENVINPTKTTRKIPNFEFRDSTDSRITSLTLDAQYFGDNLYEVIAAICDEKRLGFRVLPNFTNGGLIFELFKGVERALDQTANPYVIFSPDFDNFISSNYLETTSNYKNVALVGADGEGSARKYIDAFEGNDEPSGLSRRETFTDAYGVSKDEGTTEEDYNKQLKQKGLEELADLKVTKAFEGEIDSSRQYVYGRDFGIGDVVQVTNNYGQSGKSRVSEIVMSEDDTGFIITPTFTAE